MEWHVPSETPRSVICRNDDGEKLSAKGFEIEIKVRGGETAGRMAVMAYTIPAESPGPPLHHHAFDESFLVLDGMLTVHANGELTDLNAGDLLVVPGGAVHGFANRSQSPARFLITCSPAGFEQYFDEAVAIVRDNVVEVIPGKLAPLAAKYGLVNVGPPIAID